MYVIGNNNNGFFELRMKLLLVGPKKCGKSVIANALHESMDSNNNSEYIPTQGVRILESEKNVDRSKKVSVELWDTSGDQSFERCWPAIKQDADGVILVYNPNSNRNEQVSLWYEWFVSNNKGIKPENVLVLVHEYTNSTSSTISSVKLPAGVKTVYTNPRDLTSLREEYDDFIGNIYNN